MNSTPEPKDTASKISSYAKAIEEVERQGGVLRMLIDILSEQQPATTGHLDSPYDKGKYNELGVDIRDNPMLWAYGEHSDFGQMVDYWSDLIDGEAQKGESFAQKYSEVVKIRLPSNAQRYGGFLTTLGVYPRNRMVELIQRGSATIAVLIAKQGNDLYVSWRVYIQGFLSWWRIAVTALLIVAVMLGSVAVLRGIPGWTRGEVDYIGLIILPLGILARLVVIDGLFRRNDLWGWFREPITPLQHDDALSLGLAVHRSILAAADLSGIESVKLQPRQPLYALRKPLI